MKRDEHLQWAKDRALEYLPKDIPGALSSFISDMRKHDELKEHVGLELLGMLMITNNFRGPDDVKHQIEGFN